MAPKSKKLSATAQGATQEQRVVAPKSLPRTVLTGINAEPSQLFTVMVTAMVETTGQVRFGDGTDIDTTITEKDTVALPDGDSVLKYVWAGTKRRGVDRRLIHELRNAHRPEFTACYIGQLCAQCPICWLYGFTGTTAPKGSPAKEQDINAKSRILYATSVSVETLGQFPANRHARNAVDERTQKTGTATSGESGIHREEFIPEGIHFPIYSAAVRVLPWEVGAFAHGLLESLNSNRYTAASRAIGGMKLSTVNEWHGPALIVDVSPDGVFPLAAPKIASSEVDFPHALEALTGAVTPGNVRIAFQAMGFKVEPPASTAQNAAKPEDELIVKEGEAELLRITFESGALTMKQNGILLMTRYWGERARGYLESQRLAFRRYLVDPQTAGFPESVKPYVAAITHESKTASAGEGSEDETNTEATG